MMEVRVVTVEKHPDCPFSGTGVVIAWPAENFVRLMHPLTLDEWTMPVRDHLNQQGVIDREGYINSTADSDLLWPINQSTLKFSSEKMANILRHSFQRECLYRGLKGNTWASVKAALQALLDRPAEEVEAELKALEESTRSMPKPRGAKPKQETMEGTMATKKKASAHREGITYVATQKLDPDKFRGQANLVAKALCSYSTPKDLETITEKVKSNGGYKVNADGGLSDSVHYHLRSFVKSGAVKETKVELKAEPKAAKKAKKEKPAETEVVEEITEVPVEELA